MEMRICLRPVWSWKAADFAVCSPASSSTASWIKIYNLFMWSVFRQVPATCLPMCESKEAMPVPA